MGLELPNKLIRLSKSCISEAEKLAVLGVLDREYLGMGAEVQQFEQALGAFFDRQVLCVVNGTAALQLALQAIGVGPGDEVLVPSLTYVASFQAISATGAKPIACDIDAGTLTIDCDDAERRISERTKAIMPVHYSGGVGDLDLVYSLAKRHGLRVVEDAAHAFGTTYHDKRIGSFGDIACFSFDGIKNITSGEGGCITTSDPAVRRKVQDMRLLSVEKDTENRYSGQRTWEFDVKEQGWRYHMSNIMAAIGIEQLKRFPDFAARRQHLGFLYDSMLKGHQRICCMPNDYNSVVPHIYPVRVKALADRNALQKKLLEKGIQTGIHYQPNHVLSLYRDEMASGLPATESVFSELITLPMHADLSDHDVGVVCKSLLSMIDR